MSDGVELPPDLALSIEGLGKRRTNVHELRYTPTTSIVSRIRNRRDGAGPAAYGAADGGVVDDEEEDDDEGDEDGEPELESSPELGPAWTLHDVTFAVARGEAVAVVGDPDSVAALAQILGGMTTPTTGRVVYRGRIGLSAELARVLARREIGDPRSALRLLARVARVPRRRRKTWVRAIEALVASGESREGPPAAPQLKGRIPVAAALDPFAQILVIDRIPRASDAAFVEQCLQQLRRRLDEGAAAVIASPEPGVFAPLCRRVIELSAGTIVRVGEPGEMLAGPPPGEKQHAATDVGRARAFNADAAIMWSELTTLAGERVGPSGLDAGLQEGLQVAIRFETAVTDTWVKWQVTLTGPETVTIAQEKPAHLQTPGLYRTTLRLPQRRYAEGDYRISVEASVGRDDRRSTLRRELPGRYRFSYSDAVDAALLDTDGLVAEWSLVEDEVSL